MHFLVWGRDGTLVLQYRYAYRKHIPAPVPHAQDAWAANSNFLFVMALGLTTAQKRDYYYRAPFCQQTSRVHSTPYNTVILYLLFVHLRTLFLLRLLCGCCRCLRKPPDICAVLCTVHLMRTLSVSTGELLEIGDRGTRLENEHEIGPGRSHADAIKK